MITRSRFSDREINSFTKSGNIDRNPESGIREHGFIKNDVTGDVNATRGFIKTLVALVHRTIAQENTHLGSKLEFVSIILAKTRPTRTTKDTEKLVIRLNFEKAEKWCLFVKNRCRHAINQVASRQEGLIPET
jgi:hypothetical protein